MQDCCFLWQIALLYMLSRLVVNVTGTYWPFYVQETLDLDKVHCFLTTSLLSVVYYWPAYT